MACIPCLDRLDDLCLSLCLSRLSVTDLRAARVASTRVCRVGAEDSLWKRHIYSGFGLKVEGVSLLSLYHQLEQNAPTTVLPFQAVLTDQGCDLPLEEFWAGNLLSMSTRSSLFCTLASSSNAHVLGVLPQQSMTESPRGGPGSAPAGAGGQGSSAGPSVEPESAVQDAQASHRAMLLRYVSYPAAYLLRPLALASLRLGAMPYLSPACLAAARQRLELCSTKGLEDLFIHAYSFMAQGSAWGRSLIKGITSDDDIHQVHSVAWQVWHGQAPRPSLDLAALDPPTGRQLVDRQVLAQLLAARHATRDGRADRRQGTNPSRGEGAAQQHPGSPWSLGVWSEVQVDRHEGVTCPLRCGVVYAATLMPGQARKPSGGGHGQGEPQDWKAQGASLMDVTHHAWVTVLSGLTLVQQVLGAAAQGALPPVYGYFCCPVGEWVEFRRAEEGEEAVACTTRGDAGDGAVQGALSVDVHPVVWFRYYDRHELAAHKRRRRQEALAALQEAAQVVVTQIIESALSDVSTAAAAGGGAGPSHSSGPNPQGSSNTSDPASRSVSEAGGGAASGAHAHGAVTATVTVEFVLPGQADGADTGEDEDGEDGVGGGSEGEWDEEEEEAGEQGEQGVGVGVEEGEGGEGGEWGNNGGGPHDVLLQWAAHNTEVDALPLPVPAPPPHTGPPGATGGSSSSGALTVGTAQCNDPGAADQQLRRSLLADPVLRSALRLQPVQLPSPRRRQSGSGSGATPAAGGGGISRGSSSPGLPDGQRPPQSPPGNRPAAQRSTSGPGTPPSRASSSAGGGSSRQGSPAVTGTPQTEAGSSPPAECTIPTQTLVALHGLLHEVAQGAAQDCQQLGLWVNPAGQANSPHSQVLNRSHLHAHSPQAQLNSTQQSAGAGLAPAPHGAAGRAADAVVQAAAASSPSARDRRVTRSGSLGGAGEEGQQGGTHPQALVPADRGDRVPPWDWSVMRSALLNGSLAAPPTVTRQASGRAAAPAAAASGSDVLQLSGQPAAGGQQQQLGGLAVLPPLVATPVTRGMWEAPSPSFPFSHALPSAAPEVSSVFGWGPGSTHCNTRLFIRLHQQWAANALLVKLTASEDIRPAYNQARGGANIDAAFVACLGKQVVLPATCKLAAPNSGSGGRMAEPSCSAGV